MAERELAKEKAARLLKKRGSHSTINSEAVHLRGNDQTSGIHQKYQGYVLLLSICHISCMSVHV